MLDARDNESRAQQGEPVALTDRYTFTTTIGDRGPVRTRLALDQTTGTKVVIKTLSVKRAASTREIDLFTRECAVLEHLAHPQIPRFITHVVEDEAATGDASGDVHLHLVMEHVVGRSLKELIDAGRSFNEREVRDIARRIATVLAHIHEKSPPVVHRDIKPSNVLLKDDGTIVLIDFGAVKRAAAGDTTIVGTFGYMPPEQYEGRARPSADVFALGMTLITLLTHKEPGAFGDEGARGEFRKLANAQKPLLDLIDDMIALDPARRPANGSEVVARIDALDHRPSPSAASSGRTQKNPLAVGVAAAAIVLVAALGFFVSAPAPVAVVAIPEVPRVPRIEIPIPSYTPPPARTDVLGLPLTRFVWRCRERTIPRISQSEARYRAWLPESAGAPTCKERYITYGLYRAYDDAIAECARVANALSSKDAPELADAFAAFAPVVAHIIPLLDEAERYYDRKVYLDDGCAGARSLHERLVAAFADMRRVTAGVEKSFHDVLRVELAHAPDVDEPIVHRTRALLTSALTFAAVGPAFDDGSVIDVGRLGTAYRALVEEANKLEAEAHRLPPERASLKSKLVSIVDDVHAFRSTVHQLEEAANRKRDLRRVFTLSSRDPWRVHALADLVLRRAIDAFE
jgi:hypothetical protein